MAIIKVPKTPRKSFNQNRRPSALLLDQITHLEWAALPARQRKPQALKRYKKVTTEAQAAERIAKLTSMILDATAKPPAGPGAKPPTVVLPPVIAVRRTAARRRKTTRRGKAPR